MGPGPTTPLPLPQTSLLSEDRRSSKTSRNSTSAPTGNELIYVREISLKMPVRLVLLNVCCANITKKKCDCQFLLVVTTFWHWAFFIWIFSLVYTGLSCIMNRTTTKSLSLIILCVDYFCLSMCVCSTCMQRPEKDGYPRTGAADSYEPTWEFWESNTGPPEEQPVN